MSWLPAERPSYSRSRPRFAVGANGSRNGLMLRRGLCSNLLALTVIGRLSMSAFECLPSPPITVMSRPGIRGGSARPVRGIMGDLKMNRLVMWFGVMAASALAGIFPSAMPVIAAGALSVPQEIQADFDKH